MEILRAKTLPCGLVDKIVEEQPDSTPEARLFSGATVLASRLLDTQKELSKLKQCVVYPNYLLRQLSLVSNQLNATKHLEQIGELIYKIWDSCDGEIIPIEMRDELHRSAMRLKELAGEIESVEDAFVDEYNSYEENDDE